MSGRNSDLEMPVAASIFRTCFTGTWPVAHIRWTFCGVQLSTFANAVWLPARLTASSTNFRVIWVSLAIKFALGYSRKLLFTNYICNVIYKRQLYPTIMKTIAELISTARRELRLNQSELARRLRITPQSVQAWESGRSAPRPSLLEAISKELHIPLAHLATAVIRAGEAAQSDPDPAVLEHPQDGSFTKALSVWDDKTPLDDDEVSVPFLKEVELSAGSGRTSVEMSSQGKVRFGKATLRNLGVQFDKAVAVTVHGDSMSPLLPDGSTVGVDMGTTMIRDGKVYAINHGGHLRVKALHRLPSGGVRLRSFNREEFPDEEYTPEMMESQDLTIIGRVFWSSVLW